MSLHFIPLRGPEKRHNLKVLEPKAPKLEKKKTLDVFETSKTLTMENMRKM